MVAKLSRAGSAAPADERPAPKGWGARPATDEAPAAQAQAEPEAPRAAPKGWGRPADAAPAEPTQRERIQEKLTGSAEEEVPQTTAFSGNVQALRQAVEQGEEVPFEPGTKDVEVAVKRTRKAAPESAGAQASSIAQPYAPTEQDRLSQRIYAFETLTRCATALSDPNVHEALFDPLSDKLLELAAAL